MRNELTKKTRHLFSLLKLFPQNSLLSTFAAKIGHDTSNEETILSQSYPTHSSKRTHLVHPSNVIKSPPFDRPELSDPASSNRLITTHIRSGNLDYALKVFGRMTVRNIITWNSILAGFARTPGKFGDAHHLFEKIPEPDIVSYNTMLACHLTHCGAASALEFFDKIPVKDTVSWNTMLSGLFREGNANKARELFLQIPEKNGVSWSAMISGYVHCGDLESAVEVFNLAPIKSVVAWTALINGYMKFGKIESAESAFARLELKNVVAWNAMIAGYVENCRAEESLKLFKTMVSSGVKPNSSTMSSVLLGCSNLSALVLGKQVHQMIFKSLLRDDTTAGTSIISMYCKCGDLGAARKLFLEMNRKDVVTWNAMITGYAQHGEGQEALALFHRMGREGPKPDWITYVGVLSACNHSGLVEIGVRYFDSMVINHGIDHRPEHYTCMVDLLGRAGRLVEAVDLIKKMPFKPHLAVFGTLLGACRVHKNLQLGEYAAKSLLSLDPSSAAGYVQLANVYASAGKWDCVSNVWRSMRGNTVVKTPGYSWIEINNAVHEFRSSDRVHPELNAIHEKLVELDEKMRILGYVPDLESALHDVGVEVKEELLLYHSEKLAIAYGILRLPEGIPIRVFKNLRVCGDCHRATVFISAIERREIIVRDANRFHHFRNGVCSCGGYW